MLFVSTMTYALGKELGFPEATAEFQRQLEDPGTDSLPCVRTIARLRAYDQVGIWHDAAATCLGKARSRAFYAGLEANADIYITVDDDVEADSLTLGLLIEAVTDKPTVVFAPTIARGSNVVNVALDPSGRKRTLPKSGAEVLRCLSASFGLVAMSGETMRALVDAHPALHFFDDQNDQAGLPQVRKPALFFDLLEPVAPGHPENAWLGEDVAFCRRVSAAGVALECLAKGLTSHAGAVLRLEQVAGLSTVQAR